MDDTAKGLDPNTATGTKDAVDPETAALGTAGTPVTSDTTASGSTIGTGSAAGEQKQADNEISGQTAGAKDYSTGKNDEQESGTVPA